MGRSSRTEARQNRERIVEVASGLFRERGIEAVGIADVMKAAGMTQGGFYRHFASKDALAAEACTLAFSSAVESWTRVAQDSVKGGHTGVQGIVAFYFLERALDETCPMIALAADAAHRNPDNLLAQAYEAGVKRLFETFKASSAGAPLGDGRLRLLFAAMVGSITLARAMGGTDWVDAFKRTVIAAADYAPRGRPGGGASGS